MLLWLIDPLIFSVVIKPYIHYYPRDGASLSDRVLCDIIRAIFLSIARPSSVYNPSFFNRNLSVVASYILHFNWKDTDYLPAGILFQVSGSQYFFTLKGIVLKVCLWVYLFLE